MSSLKRKRDHLWGLLLAFAGLAAYLNSLRAVFVYDDDRGLVRDFAIRSIQPLSKFVRARGITMFTFAINYSLDGLRPRGYHIVNLAIHIGAALALYGVVARTVRIIRPAGDEAAARTFAGCVALLWVVHPLNTEAVTYAIQRAESLMALFYLLTLYASIRCAQGDAPAWGLLAIVLAPIGMMAKEVMVTVPLVVLLYDRTFLAGSFRAALRRRWWLHGAMFATWAWPLFFLGASALGHPHGSAGFRYAGWVSHAEYAWSQPRVILHYLRLALWPHPLNIDWAWQPYRTFPAALPSLSVVLILMVATLLGLRRRSWAGFAGAFFFVVLAPTSGLMPINDLAVEHRMYLPLTAVIAILVWIGWKIVAAATDSRRARALAAAAPTFALAVLTARRNQDYSSELRLWTRSLEVVEVNARAHTNLGVQLEGIGASADAIVHFERALAINPNFSHAHNGLGVMLFHQGRTEEAIAHFRRAVKILPSFANPHYQLGVAQFSIGQIDDALAHLQRAVELAPFDANAHHYLGTMLTEIDPARALTHLQRALELQPSHALAHNNLGILFMRAGRRDEALPHFEEAVRINPDYAVARRNLEAARSGTRPDAALPRGTAP